MSNSDLAQYSGPLATGVAPNEHARNSMMLMFGPPNGHQQNRYGQNISMGIMDIFDAYQGETVYLRDTVVGLALRDREFYVYIMPWLQTRAMQVKWNTFEFNHMVATRVPTQGTSRIVTYKSDSHVGSTTRYGIAFRMEGDFLGTPAGVSMYARQLQQISGVLLETVSYDTVTQLMLCKDINRDRAEALLRTPGTEDVIAEREAYEFAVAAYSRDGLARIIEDHKNAISEAGGRADTIIVFPKFMWYNDLVLEGTYTQYWQTGPYGVQMLVEGPVAEGNYRGLPVFQTRDFNPNGDNRVQPMASLVSTAEYYPMLASSLSQYDLSGYKSSWRDLGLFDIKVNNWKRVSIRSALHWCGVWGAGRGDPDGWSPLMHQQLRDTNETLKKHGAYDAEVEIYGDPQALEATAASRPARRVNMFFRHDNAARRVEFANRIGDLDIDVLPTSELIKMAQSMVRRTFGTEDMFSSLLGDYEDSQRFVQALQEVPYNDRFARAISAENIGEQVEGGRFVGLRNQGEGALTEWSPNANGGLDLPTAESAGLGVAAGGNRNLPPLSSNHPMVATLAEQGDARGWAGQDRAQKVVSLVQTVLGRFASTPVSPLFITGSGAPEWIHAKRAEAAVFGALFMNNAPAFLGADVEGVEGTAPQVAEPEETLISSAASWSSAVPAEAIVASTEVPLDDKIGALAAVNADTTIEQYESLIGSADNTADLGRENIFRGVTPDTFEERAATLQEVRAALTTSAQELVDAKTAAAQGRAYGKIVALEQHAQNDDASNPEAFRAQTQEIATSKPKSDQAVAANAATLLRGQAPDLSGAQMRGNLVYVLPPLQKRYQSAIQRVAEHPSNEGANPFQHLREIRSMMVVAGHALAGSLGQRFKVSNAAALKETPTPLGQKFKQACEDYKIVREHCLTMLAQELSKESPAKVGAKAAVGSSGPDGAPKAYFRSPLCVSQTQLRGMAGLRDVPYALPGDASQHFRVPISPNRGEDVGMSLMMQSKASVFAATIGGRLETGKREYANEPQVRAAMQVPASGRSGGAAPRAGGLLRAQLAMAEEDRRARDIDAMRTKSISAALGGFGAQSLQVGQNESMLIDPAVARTAAGSVSRRTLGGQGYRNPFGSFVPSTTADSAQWQGDRPASEFWGVDPPSVDVGLHQDDYSRDIYGNLVATAGQTVGLVPTAASRAMANDNMAYRFSKLQSVSDPLVRLAALALLEIPNRKSSWIMLVDNDIYVAINILLWRLHIEEEMYAIMVLHSGIEMGANLFNSPSMVNTANGIDKVLHSHLTWLSRAIVFFERFVRIQRNVYPRRYIAGWDTDFISRADELRHTKRGSLIATIHPVTEDLTAQRLNFINTTLPPNAPLQVTRDRVITELPPSCMTAYYETLWKLSQMAISNERSGMTVYDVDARVNTNAWRGKHIAWNPQYGRFYVNDGTGPLSGDRTGPGVAGVWKGTMQEMLKDQTQNNQFPQPVN